MAKRKYLSFLGKDYRGYYIPVEGSIPKKALQRLKRMFKGYVYVSDSPPKAIRVIFTDDTKTRQVSRIPTLPLRDRTAISYLKKIGVPVAPTRVRRVA